MRLTTLNPNGSIALRCLALSKFRDVVDGRCGNVAQRLARKESLMAGNDNIWKRQQAAENIIWNDETDRSSKKICSSSS